MEREREKNKQQNLLIFVIISLSCGTETGSCHFFAVLTKRLSVSPSLSSISQDDDFVFEDFARLRLKGVVDDKDEDC